MDRQTHVRDFARLHPLLDGGAVDEGEAEHAGARLGELLHRGRREVQVGEHKVRAPVNDACPHGLHIGMDLKLAQTNCRKNNHCSTYLFEERDYEIGADVDDEPADALVPDGHEIGPDVLLGELQEVDAHAGGLQPLHQERHVEAA